MKSKMNHFDIKLMMASNMMCPALILISKTVRTICQKTEKEVMEESSCVRCRYDSGGDSYKQENE